MINQITEFEKSETITHYEIVDNNIVVYYLDDSSIKLPNNECILERVRKDQIYQARKYVNNKVDIKLPIALGSISVLSYLPTLLTNEEFCTTISVLGSISTICLVKDSIQLVRDKKKYDFYLAHLDSFEEYSNRTYKISNTKKSREGIININNVDAFSLKKLENEYSLIKKYVDYKRLIDENISFDDFDEKKEAKRGKIFPNLSLVKTKKKK